MEFVRVVHATALKAGRRIYIYLAASALGTTAISVLINSVTDFDPDLGPDYELLAAFVLVCAITIMARGETLRIMNAVGEGLVMHLRLEFARLIRRADYFEIERIGAERIYGTLARNAQILAEAPAVLAQGVTSLAAFVLATMYIAYLSLIAAIAVLIMIGIVYLAGRLRHAHTKDDLEQAQSADRRFFESLDHYLRGIKEARMDIRLGEDLLDNFIAERARLARKRKLAALDSMIAFGALVIGSFYVLMAAVTFITPQYVDTAATAMKIVYVSSVMWLMIESLVRIWPTVARSTAAFDELQVTQRRLSQAQLEEGPERGILPSLHRLSLSGVRYAYPPRDDAPAFEIGPCDLELRPGQVVLLVGGNGSGKTTLLRTLCWLYAPKRGSVSWNGIAITPENVTDYRTKIAAVFADFHLFDRLYGRRDIDPAQVEAALERVQLTGKTRYLNGSFSTLDLSTGQRKRLALAIAMLLDKEVYIFDEIAAEQDPAFRRRIYEEFLPELKRRGKAVLVATHDEKYFHTADVVVHMDEGRLSIKVRHEA